jgi:hypothetical protein
MTPQPWFLKKDKETGIPIITIVDDMTLEKFREFLAVVSDTPSYQGSDGCLWDLRSVSDLLPTIAIRYLGACVRQVKSPLRTAIVVERDVHFGLARMFAVCSDQPSNARRVFRDYEQARAWLLQAAPAQNQAPVRSLGAYQRQVH